MCKFKIFVGVMFVHYSACDRDAVVKFVVWIEDGHPFPSRVNAAHKCFTAEPAHGICYTVWIDPVLERCIQN